MRVYQGKLKKGDFIYNINNGKKLKVPRLVRMHSNELEDITQAPAGEIVAMFGVECASGDTFTCGKQKVALSSMHVADPVMSLAITPVSRDVGTQFSKALSRFQVSTKMPAAKTTFFLLLLVVATDFLFFLFRFVCYSERTPP